MLQLPSETDWKTAQPASSLLPPTPLEGCDFLTWESDLVLSFSHLLFLCVRCRSLSSHSTLYLCLGGCVVIEICLLSILRSLSTRTLEYKDEKTGLVFKVNCHDAVWVLKSLTSKTFLFKKTSPHPYNCEVLVYLAPCQLEIIVVYCMRDSVLIPDCLSLARWPWSMCWNNFCRF